MLETLKISKKYLLLDSGGQEKLEMVGPFCFVRPAAAAIWPKSLSEKQWQIADAVFSRKEGGWHFKKKLPASWEIEIDGIKLKVMPTSFGHFGFFPEHFELWQKLSKYRLKGKKILNLFAYTGASSLLLASLGASVCHLDASKASVKWAKENALLNHLEKKPVRWIVDDVFKFLKREEKRKSFYDGIILDPPTFGRGSRQEVFKIETAILPMLQKLEELLNPKACFLAFSCHTPGFTPLLLKNLFNGVFKNRKGRISAEELSVPSENSPSLPAGMYALWETQTAEFTKEQ